MEFDFRAYQVDAEDKLLQDVLSDSTVHPVVALPTGTGKSKVIGNFIYKYLEVKPKHNIVVISHTEDILKQDYKAISSFFPEITLGLYSSGLKSKTTFKITIAGIQSVYRRPDLFKDFHLCIVDEAHSIPTKGNGMYQQLFKALPHLRRVGFTATHFRLGHGYIHKGEGALFNKLSVDYSSMDAFNNLIEDGYMSKLYNKPADYQLNVDGVKTTAGDYNIKDLSNKCDRQAITEAAVKQAVEYGHNYKSWLIFAINIEHAEHINSELLKHDIKSKVLHSKGREDRHSVTDEFKDRSIRAIVSVGMITTGFDAPNIDLIILLRPTKSPVLHIQMIGRGSRIHPNKEHCLILDFAGNIARLGPINCVQVPTKRKKKKDGRPIVKTCPICKCLHHPTVKICEVCGHVFTFKETIRNFFDNNVEVIRKKKESWMGVSKVFYTIHRKQGSPNSLKVTYKCGLRTITEWVCYDHSGYAGKMARHWVLIRSIYRGKESAIKNVQDLFRYSNDLKVPDKILVDMSNKYPTIKEVKFE